MLTAAAAIRLIGVTTRGIQYDDAFSILLASRPVADILKGTAADTMPPLYYLVLHVWQFLGKSVAFLRLPGILFSLGIIVLAYLLVNRFAGRTAAIWTAAIVTISPLQYYHAQDVRMYTLATLFILGWNLAALELAYRVKPSVFIWFSLILCGAGALYSHALAGFGLLAPYVYFLVKRNWQGLMRLLIAGLATTFMYLPWLVMVPGQIAKVQNAFWTPRPGIVEILQSGIMLLGDIPSPPLVMGVVLFCVLSISVLCGMEVWTNRKYNQSLVFFLFIAIIPPVCLFVLSYMMRPMFVSRGFLSAYIGAAAIIGILAARARTPVQILIGTFVLAASVITLPFQITYNRFPRSPFQSASQFLEETVKDGDVILHDNKLSFFPVKVYSPNLPSRFLGDKPGSPNDTLAAATQSALGISAYMDATDAVSDYGRVFFVVFQETITEYKSIGGHPVIRELSGLFGQPVDHVFGDLLILEFPPKIKTP